MKNKKCTIAFASALFLWGAVANADHHCKGPDAFNLTVKKFHLDLDEHKPVCITVPGTVFIRIKNPPGGGHDVGPGDVTVSQKEPVDPDVEISGDNLDDEEYLKITIDGDANEDEEFRFLIAVDDVGVLDPRVRVVPSAEVDALFRLAVQQHIYELNAIAKAYGATPEQAFELARKVQSE